MKSFCIKTSWLSVSNAVEKNKQRGLHHVASYPKTSIKSLTTFSAAVLVQCIFIKQDWESDIYVFSVVIKGISIHCNQ